MGSAAYSKKSASSRRLHNGFFGGRWRQRARNRHPARPVQEFRVVATGATAEFGRTAGGVVNVITKSGTKRVSRQLFHFRASKPDAETSDGSRSDFTRTVRRNAAGRSKREAFFFFALESNRENLDSREPQRTGRATVPVGAPNILETGVSNRTRNAALALLEFFRTTRRGERACPSRVRFKHRASAKIDWTSPSTSSALHNFDTPKTRTRRSTCRPTATGHGVEGRRNHVSTSTLQQIRDDANEGTSPTRAKANRARRLTRTSPPNRDGLCTTFGSGDGLHQPTGDELFRACIQRQRLAD